MTFLAVVLLITTSCASRGRYEPLFFGDIEQIEIAASAAKQCGVRSAQVSEYEKRTALFIPSSESRSSEANCLYSWWREQRPDGLGMIVVTK